jgi:hypothetical protein
MSHRSKINVKTISGSIAICCVLIFSLQVNAYHAKNSIQQKSLTGFLDTIPAKEKGVKPLDTIKPVEIDTGFLSDEERDSIKIIQIKKIDFLTLSKDSLDAVIKYTASDSGEFIIPTKQFILHGKADVEYKTTKLKAGVVDFNAETQIMKAYGKPIDKNDTTKEINPLDYQVSLADGNSTSKSDTITMSLKTLKGKALNTYYNEDDIYINATALKKVDSITSYAWKARFTTCNLDTPHFAFRARKMKLINNKLGISGPTSAEVEGIPIPIGIPFGIYPLNRGRHSGILTPSFITSPDFGLGLQGLGFYKVINDYWDATIKADLYSYGGYLVSVNSKYIKRYRYVGGLNVSFQNTRTLNHDVTSKDQFTGSKTFMINWSHNVDGKARPGTTFGANVNFGSTKYNKSLYNNPYQNYNNKLTSSISYGKNFNNKANLSVNINHDQDNNTHLVHVGLPSIAFSLNNFFPLQKKEKIGTPKWYENIGIAYTGSFINQFAFYDTAFSFQRMLDTAQYGATHSIPITLTLPSLGPITVSPFVSYQENWHGQKLLQTWNKTTKRIDSLLSKGLYTERQMSFGIGASTRIFGTYAFKNSKNGLVIKHEMRPTISFSYHPDLVSQYYYTLQIDTFGHTKRASQLAGIISPFSEGNSGAISFGIDNLLDMKVKDKKDTTANAFKKVKLIDGFGFNSSYNLLADSFALSPFTFYVRSTLFEKINITANAILDPYKLDKYGYPINSYAWQGSHFSLGRITTASLAISTSFQSKAKDGKTDKERLAVDPFMTPDEQQRQLEYVRSNPAEYTDFNIPWSINLSYSLTYNNTVLPDSSGAYSYQKFINSNVSFSGDFSISPKWKAGGNGYFDFNTGKLQQFSMFLSRDMHCWQLSINVNPIGLWRSFSITISPKSGILRDLKVNRNRSFSGG